MRVSERVESFAFEFLSQLTTVACGVLLGIVTSPRGRRAIFTKALALVRRGRPPACELSRALVESPPVHDGRCEAFFVCVDDSWDVASAELPSPPALLALALLLAVLWASSIRARPTRASDKASTPVVAFKQPLRNRRDSRRAYVSVEYDRLVASTTMACQYESSTQ
jgi:hypothetical protein